MMPSSSASVTWGAGSAALVAHADHGLVSHLERRLGDAHLVAVAGAIEEQHVVARPSSACSRNSCGRRPDWTGFPFTSQR
jgi:hypothetical protein